MSGWLERNLPESLDADLAGYGVPAAAVREIKGIAVAYWHLRDDRVPSTARETADDLKQLEAYLEGVYSRLSRLELETAAAIREAGRVSGRSKILETCLRSVDELQQMVALADQQKKPEKGRGGSRRTWLAVELADALQRHGVAVDPKRSGTLVRVIGAVFKATKQKGKDGAEPDPENDARNAIKLRKNRAAPT